MKVHIKEKDGVTYCGGRISGAKQTGKRQYFDVSIESFFNAPVKDPVLNVRPHSLILNTLKHII